jgi:hypothetical protein
MCMITLQRYHYTSLLFTLVFKIIPAFFLSKSDKLYPSRIINYTKSFCDKNFSVRRNISK